MGVGSAQRGQSRGDSGGRPWCVPGTGCGSHLIRASAISAIIDGSERITRRLLDSVPVDYSTQSDNPAPTDDDEEDGIGDAA